MFKYCVLLVYKCAVTVVQSADFCPAVFAKYLSVGITATFTQLCKRLVRPFIHIKFLLNQTVKGRFSTVSTIPTTKTTILKVNNLLITRKFWFGAPS